MLQIATGMYFRKGVPIRETTHRAAFYTNAGTLRAETVELPIGKFSFASGIAPITAVMVEVIDRMETEQPDGTPEFIVSSGGKELLADAATVFAFALNVSCARSLSLLERNVPRVLDATPSQAPSNTLRRTFDPQVFLTDSSFDEVRRFSKKLLSLDRADFEAAMRSIRKVTDATLFISEDPSLSYTLFVSALESLAQQATSAEEYRSWETYDHKKRAIIEPTLKGLERESAARIREAILEADQLSLGRRFRIFALEHVTPSFYRAEARDSTRPISANDLPHALNVAYRIRSRNIHVLEVLAPELRLMFDRGETLRFEGRWVLSLEGLNRLSRHVIKTFVDRCVAHIDPEFNYRAHLPGRVQMQLAPQYWISQAEIFTRKSAPQILEGLLEILISEDPSKSLPDLTPVLERIEQLLPAENDVEHRRPMTAIYVLWDTLLDLKHRRPNARHLISKYSSDLDAPTSAGFAVRILAGKPLEWSTDELRALADRRQTELKRGKGQPLPPRLDTALLLETSLRLWDATDLVGARTMASAAMESFPGDEKLLRFEEQMLAGERPEYESMPFVFGSIAGEHT